MPFVTLATTLFILSLHLLFGSGTSHLSTGFQVGEEKQWILAGLSLIRRLDCNQVTSISPQECMKIRISPASRFVAYVASREPSSSTDLCLSHPELGDEISTQDHDNLTGVLILDPLADRAFGHPLFVFRIVNISGNRDEQLRKCLDRRGLLYKNECIHQDVKPDCPFIFPSAGQQDNDPKSPPSNQVCEYQFFPKVTSSEEPEKNLLQCVPHASPCVSNPQQRQRRKRLYRRRVILPTYGNPVWNRDPQWINPLTRRESGNSILPHRTVRHSPLFEFNQRVPNNEGDSICSSYDRCDHALLLTNISGDKHNVDNHFSSRSHRRNLLDKLRSLGFASRFISVFPPEVRPHKEYHFFDLPNKLKDSQRNMSIKSSFRSRLQKLCHTPRCVSTLFIYLNNFVLPNGDMLIGSDNLTDPNVRYSVSEFLSDLSGCQASLIFAVVDQNFGGILLEGLKSRPMEFGNLFLLSATRQANAFQGEQPIPERPLSEFFYPRHYAFRVGHYGLYGVEDLLTYSVENLPLSQMVVGDIEKQIKSLFPHLELGSFYGNRIQAHSTALFSKPVAVNPHEGGFLQGRLSGQSRPLNTTPRRYIAGCVSLSPIDWLRNYLPSTDQIQRH
ncbi:unnamed protein product [Hymenolepis diminuta]|uniref:Uncharacterized protein n=2 Tax=Hymenolepis diminuta TaxID=6216 RepID=A0A564YED9_HYMDI|nr:unnamed protein product [Hymenolepis diminuta]